MKKFLIINAYSSRNFGDAGIVVAMINLIRSKYPDSEIKVMSSYFKENESFYNYYKASSINAIWPLRPGTGFLSRYFKGLLVVLRSILKPKSESFFDYHWADCVLGAGGGYLYSSKKGALGVGILSALFHYWLAIRLGKIIIAFPQSVGPLTNRYDNWLASYILAKINVFMSREAITTNLLKTNGLKNVVEVADIAFCLGRNKSEFNLLGMNNPGELKVGLTVLDWRFAKVKTTDEDIEIYIKKIATALKNVKKKHASLKVYIFPQVMVGVGDSDVPVSKKLVEQLGANLATYVKIPGSIKPEELVSLYGNMNVFIGSRMHSTIFAMNAEVPTIGLSYQPKTEGTFALLGGEDFVLQVDDFDSDSLEGLVLECLNKGKQTQQLLANLKDIRKKTCLTAARYL